MHKKKKEYDFLPEYFVLLKFGISNVFLNLIFFLAFSSVSSGGEKVDKGPLARVVEEKGEEEGEKCKRKEEP